MSGAQVRCNRTWRSSLPRHNIRRPWERPRIKHRRYHSTRLVLQVIEHLSPEALTIPPTQVRPNPNSPKPRTVQTPYGKWLTRNARPPAWTMSLAARASLSEILLTDSLATSSWDERRVADWLRAINCAQYEQLFRGQLSCLSVFSISPLTAISQ